MRRRWATLILVAVFALLLVPTPASAGPENPGGDEARFVELVNAARKRGGAAPLKVDPQLTALARSWAEQMAYGACGTKPDGSPANICHAGSLSAGVSADWEKLGENVGYGPNVDAVMNAFIGSSKHHENLMDPAFTRIGVGVVWKDGALYTVHRFMQVRGEGAPQPQPEPQPQAQPEQQPQAPAAPAAPAAPRKSGSSAAPAASAPETTAPPDTTPPAPPAPTPPVAEPSRVAVVLLALRNAPL